MTADWITMQSKYRGHCSNCGDEIEAGETIQWMPGVGAKHIQCRQTDIVNDLVVDDGEKIPYTWKDAKKYSLQELNEIKNCQLCGIELTGGDVYVNDDRRVCEKHFGV